MNNTDKLLRAFIKASGYEIEEVKGGLSASQKETLRRDALCTGVRIPCDEFLSAPCGTDYKVTKAPLSSIGLIEWGDMTNPEQILVLKKQIEALENE